MVKPTDREKESQSIQEVMRGKVFTLRHCKGAMDTLGSALKSLPAKKQQSMLRGLKYQFEKLLDGQRLSSENFPQEGKLPCKHPVTGSDRYNAFKRIPIRAYCWFSIKYPDTWFVSHYVYKNYDKLKPKDTNIVVDNWNEIEGE